MTPEEYERCQPLTSIVAAGQNLRFATPNPASLQRVERFVHHERDAIAWLKELPAGATLLDIGAGIGLHAVYAVVVRKARVFAFEPEAENYAVLCRNLLLNGAAGRATAWCAAVSADARFHEIYLGQGAETARAVGDRSVPLRLEAFGRAQGCVATTIDTLVASGAITVPYAIRIDAAGSEHQIMRGAQATLQNADVRTLTIRIDPALEAHRWILDRLASLGFGTNPAQVARAQEMPDQAGAVIFMRN